MKKTLVIGASSKQERPSYECIIKLQNKGIPTEAISGRPGNIDDIKFHVGEPELNDIDTVTLYLGKLNQPPLYNYIIGLEPRRVIFNPGAENKEFEELLILSNIEPIVGCTLVMLNIGTF